MIGITIIVKCIVEHDHSVPWLHEQVQYTRCWVGVVLSRLFACVDTRVKVPCVEGRVDVLAQRA